MTSPSSPLPASLRDRQLAPLSVWLLGFTAGFASSLYVSVSVVSWITAVALLLVTPVFVLSRKMTVGFAGFALGLAAMLLWRVTNPPGGCEGLSGCPDLAASELYAGTLLAVIAIALLLWSAFRARARYRSE